MTKGDTTLFYPNNTTEESERTVSSIIESAGELHPESSIDDVDNWLKSLRAEIEDCSSRRRGLVRDAAKSELENVEEISSPARLVDTIFNEPSSNGDASENGQDARFKDPEPCTEPVDGAELLTDLSEWLSSYIWMEQEAADAAAVWTAATWFVKDLYFAPVLALLSPTKQCGKTRMLDLLSRVVRRGHRTSGVGVTEAVIFRLNEKHQPTLLIDEAEKLSSAHRSRNLISLLNEGYRKGSVVDRCAEDRDGYTVKSFDAFGFRAVAAIGDVWDTLLDRSIIINMDRKPRDVNLRRFAQREVEREGENFSAQLARWRNDHRDQVIDREETAPRPEWMSDRACDYWAPLFAIGATAGEAWLDRLKTAARSLETTGREEDAPREQLIRDIRQVFANEDWPEAIKSGKLANKLNRIETSPWADRRGGKGLSAHKIARMLKPFGVRPEQHRDSRGDKIRGYWWTDLEPVCERYCQRSPSQDQSSKVGQAGQTTEDEDPERPTSPTNSGTQTSQTDRQASRTLSQFDDDDDAGQDGNVPDVPNQEGMPSPEEARRNVTDCTDELPF